MLGLGWAGLGKDVGGLGRLYIRIFFLFFPFLFFWWVGLSRLVSSQMVVGVGMDCCCCCFSCEGRRGVDESVCMYVGRFG